MIPIEYIDKAVSYLTQQLELIEKKADENGSHRREFYHKDIINLIDCLYDLEAMPDAVINVKLR